MLADQIHLFINPPCFAPSVSNANTEPDQVQRTIAKLFQEKAADFERRFGDQELLVIELHNRSIQSDVVQGGCVGGLLGFAIGLMVLPLLPLTTVLGAATGALCCVSVGQATYELSDVILAERLNRAGMAAAKSCNRIAKEILMWDSIEGFMAQIDQVDWVAFKERLRVCPGKDRVRRIASVFIEQSTTPGLAHTRYAELKRIGKEKRALCC